MSNHLPSQHPTASSDPRSNPLLNVFHNSLLLSQIVPYISAQSILSLAAASRSLYLLVYEIYPRIVFRRLELACKVYSSFHYEPVGGTLPSLLGRALNSLRGKDVLSFITTLVLDHQVVPAKLLQEVLQEEPYNVRILSIRDASCLDEDGEELLKVLQNLINPSRPGASPKLKGLYCFGEPDKPSFDPTLFYRNHVEPIHVPRRADTAEGVTTTAGSHLGQSTSTACALEKIARWTGCYGKMFELNQTGNEAWARLMIASEKMLAFDTVVCRHGPDSHVAPRVADINLGPEGCQICHAAPENALIFGQSPVHELPLLAPVPLFASTVKAAQSISPNENAKLYARCTLCMRDRRCSLCNAWWCENCYTPPSQRPMGAVQADTKVYLGFCVQNCLVGELYHGAGEGGMWG